jgi:hypothetical protein
MSQVDCPYCGKEVEIDHDDGKGYEEGPTYTQECNFCEKTFVYTTSIHFSHHAEKAPCQNGEPHDWQPIIGYPVEYFIGRKRCSYCDEEVKDA